MAEEPPSATTDRELTTNIVAGYVRKNQIASDQLGTLISTVHRALTGLGKSPAEIEIERTPAVPIRRSVHRDYVVCLECGWRGKMLRKHLATGHGLSVDQYRARWKLPREHPLTAPNYTQRRSELAKQLGLGRKPKTESATAQSAEATVEERVETNAEPRQTTRSRAKSHIMNEPASAPQARQRQRRSRGATAQSEPPSK